jgi:hypothetical protein
VQQFTVPQFIDVENKIIGPVTSRQFVIMMATFLILAIFYKFFDFSLFLTTGLPVLAASVVIAFVKVNGRPFHFFMLNIIETFKKPSIRVWINDGVYTYTSELQTGRDKKKSDTDITPNSAIVKKAPMHTSRLAELTLTVDTGGAYREG